MKRLTRRMLLSARATGTAVTALWALAAAIGCGETTTTPNTSLTFDRPVDIAFACYGGLRITADPKPPIDQPIETTAMPMFGCEARALLPVERPIGCQPPDPPPPKPGQPPPPPTRFTDPSTPAGQETLYDPTDTTQDGECEVISQGPVVDAYALVLETGPGIVNVMKFAIQQPAPGADFTPTVNDSDPLTPGVNGIAVGEEPVAIVTDPAGCHAITANAGSCDLSVLDLNTALDTTRGAKVDRLAIKNAAGLPVVARPVAMVGQPSSVEIGNRCPAAPTGLVYVAYPGCHLVAGIDTSTGTIVTGIQYDAAGVPSIVGGDVTCPDECGGGGGTTAGVRPVALDLELDPRSGTRRLVIGADNSASIGVVELDDSSRPLSVSQVALEDKTGTLGISALALSPEIGMGGGNPGFLDAIDDETAGGTFQFVYAVATDGTVRVADVLGVRKECDTQIDPRFSRQVTSVDDLACFPAGASTTPPRRAGARGPGIRLPGFAIPLSVEFVKVDKIPDPPSGVSHSPADIQESRKPDLPGSLIGYFAVITASNGLTYVVNVDDDDYPDLFDPTKPLAVSMPLAVAHQLRDARGRRSATINDEDLPYDPCVHFKKNVDPEYDDADPNKCKPNPTPEEDHSNDDKNCDYNGQFEGTNAVGGPRSAGTPERKAPAGTYADSTLSALPRFRQITCDRRMRHDKKSDAADYKAISELQYAAETPTRDATFPDLMALPDAETWSMVWEGSLSLNTGATNIDGPAIRESLLKVDSAGIHVLDDGKPFCDAGVEPYDILQLRGCDPAAAAADCPSGYTCFVHPESKISGLGACMLSNEADRLANACRDYLLSVRRYTVATAASGELLAMPRRFELSTTPVDGCVSNSQCDQLADYADQLATSSHPKDFKRTCDSDNMCEAGESAASCPSDCAPVWACVADPSRAPREGTGKRCELPCETNDGCPAGAVCQAGFCMEGIIPPQACINASQRYELHAGEAFAVIGSLSGFVHPIIADAGGKCVRDPAASPLLLGRLPLLPRNPAGATQMCDPTADPLTGRLPAGGFEPNPCATTVTNTDVVPNYSDPAACGLSTVEPLVELKQRPAPAVRFRNRGMTFTMVDPYSPGDQTCVADQKGTRGQIPHVVPGYTMSFRPIGGFVAQQTLTGLSVEDRPSFPVKVLRGPANSVWVVDEGDFLSSSAGSPSTRGKVMRIEPLAPTAGVTIK